MARALARVVAPERLTVIVNVADDDFIYGVHVAADLDTVVYTLAGIEGPHGWGIEGDSFRVVGELAKRGDDTTFRLGDRDLATCLFRTSRLRSGTPLSTVTAELAAGFGVEVRVLPVTDNSLRTRVQLADGSWISFQDYFVRRGHRDEVAALDYQGAGSSRAAPGVVSAIEEADLVVIAPSNPPLSIWPILAVPDLRPAVQAAARVVAISPFFGGKTLKGPAAEIMASLGIGGGTRGVLTAYEGLLSALIVDEDDAADEKLSTGSTRILSTPTRIADPEAGRNFAAWLIDTMAT